MYQLGTIGADVQHFWEDTDAVRTGVSVGVHRGLTCLSSCSSSSSSFPSPAGFVLTFLEGGFSTSATWFFSLGVLRRGPSAC